MKELKVRLLKKRRELMVLLEMRKELVQLKKKERLKKQMESLDLQLMNLQKKDPRYLRERLDLRRRKRVEEGLRKKELQRKLKTWCWSIQLRLSQDQFESLIELKKLK